MPIITEEENDQRDHIRYEMYPDQFVSDKKKQSKAYIKENMDFWANIAYTQYGRHKNDFANNYDLVKGILHPSDFYEEAEVKNFMDTLSYDQELPPNVKHYPILNPPLNTLVGELNNRPDLARVKAMDADSQNQELQAKTDLVHQYIIQEAKAGILTKNAMQGGEEPSEEDLDRITMEKVQDYLSSYTSIAERWANRVLTSCKVEFNMKELSEEGFRDLLIAAREFYHVYEDNSKTGFNIEVVNPRNEWHVFLADKKYTSDPSGGSRGTPAAGVVSIKELSEIIERFPLSKDEIDHLREHGNGDVNTVPSSFATREVGIGSVKYPQGSHLRELERVILESQLSEENDGDISSALGLSSYGSFGNKFVVVEAYWISKKKIANVVYIDEQGQEQRMLVDENYEEVPNQISIEWGWINQWMKGYKIGPHIYNVEPLRILDYCPIIGVVHEGKNTKARSIIDLMKPLQTLYNVCMNQLFRLLEKELGVFTEIPIRKITTPKDGDGQDALDVFEQQAKDLGFIYTDESVENTKVPTSNTSIVRVHDASLSNQIMSRYQTAMMLKNECWELVGITRQRLGGTSGATETATATQAGLSQSYTQTEPLFTQHQYILNQVYQAIVDAAQYTTITRGQSTISYLSDDGDSAFMQINGEDLHMRDLKTFITSRAEDVKIFEKMQQLGDALLQNGGDMYDVSVLYESNSLRQKQEILLKLKQQRESMQQQQQQLEQQQLEQQQAQFQAEMQYKAEQDRILMENENYQKELDRINKKEIAIINSFSKQEDNTKDRDGNGVPDMLEYSRLNADMSIAASDHARSLLELQQKNEADRAKVNLEREKLQVDRENMKNDLQIAKVNAKNRAKPSKAKKK